MSDHAEGVLPPTEARLTFEDSGPCGSPAPIARVSIRRESLENELAAIQVEIDRLQAIGPKNLSRLEEAWINQATGAKSALRWVLLGFDGELPFSVIIGAWHNSAKNPKQI